MAARKSACSCSSISSVHLPVAKWRKLSLNAGGRVLPSILDLVPYILPHAANAGAGASMGQVATSLECRYCGSRVVPAARSRGRGGALERHGPSVNISEQFRDWNTVQRHHPLGRIVGQDLSPARGAEGSPGPMDHRVISGRRRPVSVGLSSVVSLDSRREPAWEAGDVTCQRTADMLVKPTHPHTWSSSSGRLTH